jgi:hypothetical protein
MSSLARRSMRTSAAVAGIAAASLGLATPAIASPALPDTPDSNELDSAPTTSDTTLIPGVIGGLGGLPTGLSDLPMPFQFDPSVHTDEVQFDVQSAPPRQLDGELSSNQGDTLDTLDTFDSVDTIDTLDISAS